MSTCGRHFWRSKNSREKFTPQNPNPSGTGPGGLKPLFLLRARRTFFYKGVGFYLCFVPGMNRNSGEQVMRDTFNSARAMLNVAKEEEAQRHREMGINPYYSFWEGLKIAFGKKVHRVMESVAPAQASTTISPYVIFSSIVLYSFLSVPSHTHFPLSSVPRITM